MRRPVRSGARAGSKASSPTVEVRDYRGPVDSEPVGKLVEDVAGAVATDGRVYVCWTIPDSELGAVQPAGRRQRLEIDPRWQAPWRGLNGVPTRRGRSLARCGAPCCWRVRRGWRASGFARDSCGVRVFNGLSGFESCAMVSIDADWNPFGR
jgi:hypothetical protein